MYYTTIGRPGCITYNNTCKYNKKLRLWRVFGMNLAGFIRYLSGLMFSFTGVASCPENMHRVDSECRPTPSQRTCDEPVAMPMGVICGWSRCDCDFPFVLHLPSGYCFAYEDCP